MSRTRLVQLSAVVAAALCSLAFAAVAAADTVVVNTTADSAPSSGACKGGGECSLRQAVDFANGVPGGLTTIDLPSGHYHLTIPPEGSDSNSSGDLDIGPHFIHIKGDGARKTVIDASGLGDRVLRLNEGADVELADLTVTGGRVDEDQPPGGGGILAIKSELTLEGVAVSNNVAAEGTEGGGLSLIEDETAFIFNSTISGNRNSGNGGGLISQLSGLIMLNSTLAGNTVETSLYPGADFWGAYGGAAEFDGSSVVMVNVTAVGNQIIDDNGGSEGGGAAFYGNNFEDVIAVGTLVGENSGSNVDRPGQCSPPFGASAFNLESPPPSGEARCFGGEGDLVGAPLVAPLENYGGETDTVALFETSPAIDAAETENCPKTDQRGEPRPFGARCDIGAWEGKPLPLPPKPVAPQVAPPGPKPSSHATISKQGKVVVKAAGKGFTVKPGITVSCAAGVDCPVALTATAKLPKTAAAGKSAKRKPPLIGRTSFSLKAGKSQALSFKLSAKGAKLLREAGKLGARFEVVAGTATATKSATLKLPRTKR